MRTKVAALAAAAAVLGSVAISTGSANAAAGDPPFAGVTISMSPANGNSGTNFGMNFTTTSTGAPVSAACPGDNPAGWFWTAFIVPAGTDIGGLTFGASGSPNTPAGGDPTKFRPLATPTGTFLRAQAPGLGDGAITPPAGLWLGNFLGGPGSYQVGVACYDSNNATVNLTGRYYSTPITITTAAGQGPQNFTYAFGAAPVAPVLTTSSYNSGTNTATVNFTHAASVPATTGYTATVTGTPAIAPISVPAGATSFQIPGVALGSTYTVTLVATNPTGSSSPSNSLTVSGAATTPAPVVTANSVFENDPITASWTQPAGPVAPTDYTVVLSGGSPAITPISQTVAGLSASFATQPVGNYTVTVTPNYPAGSGVVGTPGVDTFDVTPGALIKQELTVTRPTGALILTQRCGVYNTLPAFPAVANFPGYPFSLSAATPTTNQVGTAPTLDAGGADPEFGNYPLPNDNPASGTDVPFGNVTTCGLDMGVARFVTETNISVGGSGAQFLTGNFFAADGRLNEVTVLDTRDIDAGWTLRGDIEDRFTQPSGDSFSGDYLGWQPVMTDDSNIIGGEGPGVGGAGALYDQTVVAGPTVLPGDGFPAGGGFVPGAIGMTDNPVLASAAGGAGLGISTHDARLLLLIPVTRDSGNYAATLTLTVG
jgi:hypothetical protein